MSLVSANLHFHGLTIPLACHQDEVLKNAISDLFDLFNFDHSKSDDRGT